MVFCRCGAGGSVGEHENGRFWDGLETRGFGLPWGAAEFLERLGDAPSLYKCEAIPTVRGERKCLGEAYEDSLFR
jgi:hypothetical protein